MSPIHEKRRRPTSVMSVGSGEPAFTMLADVSLTGTAGGVPEASTWAMIRDLRLHAPQMSRGDGRKGLADRLPP
jgi:hypothetical protein